MERLYENGIVFEYLSEFCRMRERCFTDEEGSKF